jgi:hypothetical protein
LDFVDKVASGPILEDDALVAAVKRKAPIAKVGKPANEEAANG